MLKKVFPIIVAVCVVMGTAFAAGEGLAPMGKKDPNSPQNLKDRVVKILRTTNKAQLNRYVPKVYEFKNVNPNAVAALVRDVVRTEEGLLDTYVAKDGKSGLMLVAVPEYQIPYLDRLAAQLDRPQLTSASGSKWSYVELRHRSALDGDVPQSLLLYGASDNAIVADPPRNAVFVWGSPSGVDAILAAALEYDIPTPEVNVEAKIYEIDVTNDGTLGLDYMAWKNGPGKALFTLGAFGEYEKIDYGQGVNNGMQFDSGAGTFGLPQRRFNTHGYNASYYWDVPSAFFDYLVVKGKGKVTTAPNVTVLSGIPAVFRNVEEILFYRVNPAPPSVAEAVDPDGDTEDHLILPMPPGQALLSDSNYSVNSRTVTGATTNRQVASSVMGMEFYGLSRLSTSDYAESGVVLWVEPTISQENIDLEILTSVASFTGFDDAGVPMVNTRVYTSKVRAKDGEEIVGGGFTRERSVQTTQKMPILGSIPVIGYLFGGETTTKKVNTVVQVIKPSCAQNCGGLSDRQRDAISQAKGELSVEMGADEFGFEMYWIGREKYAE
ncbi:hypothetical protein JW916_04590 [Candidatus Sumerlaeota bacterium]|nr:hypothetical protein [Candidatus Sumerlaeota bacterium]